MPYRVDATRPTRQSLLTDHLPTAATPPVPVVRSWIASTGKDLTIGPPPSAPLLPLVPERVQVDDARTRAGAGNARVFGRVRDLRRPAELVSMWDDLHTALMQTRSLESGRAASGQQLDEAVHDCHLFFRAFTEFVETRLVTLSSTALQSFRRELYPRVALLLADTTPLWPEPIDHVELEASFRLHLVLRWHLLRWIDTLSRYPFPGTRMRGGVWWHECARLTVGGCVRLDW